MVKPACFDSNGMKKGAWSEDEDNRLKAYVEKYGHWNWRLLPKYAGLARCGKSCRLRWVNYLKPGVKRGKFSKEEVNLIIQMHQEFGNRWSAMAEKLQGRTDNDIKNYWHAHIHKRINRPSNKLCTKKRSVARSSSEDSVNVVDIISCVKSTETSGSSSTYDHLVSCDLLSENESFWNDPALADLSNGGIENYVPAFTTQGELQLHHTELSSSSSSNFSPVPALQWNIADGDHGIFSPDSRTRSEFQQGSIWDESYYWETDFQGDVSYSAHLTAQEEERSYDIFPDFDYSMNLF